MNPTGFFLALFIPGLLYSCNPTQFISNQNLQQQEAIKKVTLLEDRWMKALVAKDTSMLSGILAADFTLSGSSPVKETRTQYLQTSAMPERSLQPLTLQDRELKLYNNTIISTGKTTYKGNWKERAFELQVRYTHVYVLNKKNWHVVSAHLSAIE